MAWIEDWVHARGRESRRQALREAAFDQGLDRGEVSKLDPQIQWIADHTGDVARYVTLAAYLVLEATLIGVAVIANQTDLTSTAQRVEEASNPNYYVQWFVPFICLVFALAFGIELVRLLRRYRLADEVAERVRTDAPSMVPD